MKDLIDETKGQIIYWQQRLAELYKTCSHNWIKRGDSLVCSNCRTNAGWWCPKSPERLCQYEINSEYCIYCGMPDERK